MINIVNMWRWTPCILYIQLTNHKRDDVLCVCVYSVFFGVSTLKENQAHKLSSFTVWITCFHFYCRHFISGFIPRLADSKYALSKLSAIIRIMQNLIFYSLSFILRHQIIRRKSMTHNIMDFLGFHLIKIYEDYCVEFNWLRFLSESKIWTTKSQSLFNALQQFF